MMHSDAWRDRFISAFGEEAYEKKLVVRIANARAAASNGLQPTHLFGKNADLGLSGASRSSVRASDFGRPDGPRANAADRFEPKAVNSKSR